jgi:hypothetical protein
MECGICYSIIPEENFKVLECMHSICQSCFSKLHSYTCPFCRTPISELNKNIFNNYSDDYHDDDDNNGIFEILYNQTTNRRSRRNRRSRARRNHPNNVPQNISTQDINAIRQQISTLQLPTEIITYNNESIPDNNRQRLRSIRNRWRNYNNHQTPILR